MTLSEAEFLRTRLAALEPVKNEDELMAWDDETSATYEYLSLPQAAIDRLENAYREKLAWIYGIGGG